MSYYYVYIYYRNEQPVYVGMGQGNRWKSHLRRPSCNMHLRNLIEKSWTDDSIEICVKKIAERLTVHEARVIEIALIKLWGKVSDGGILFNITDGGEGTVGRVTSAEHRKAISDYRKSRKGTEKLTEERCAEISKRRKQYLLENPQELERVRSFCSSISPEERGERTRRTNAAMGLDKKRKAIAKTRSYLTAEDRRENARKANETLGPEGRSERSRRAQAAITPETRARIVAATLAGQAKIDRKAASIKGQETRRRNRELRLQMAAE